jgi:signal transduction histidine kinase
MWPLLIHTLDEREGSILAPVSPNAQARGDAAVMNEYQQLEHRLESERRARQEAEAVAEGTIRALYDRQRDIQLLREVAFAANAAHSITDALASTVSLVCEHAEWPLGHAYLVDATRQLIATNAWHDASTCGRFDLFKGLTRTMTFTGGVGLPGTVVADGRPVWIEDVSVHPNFPRNRGNEVIGVHAAFGVPVLVGRDVRAVMEFFRDEPAPPDDHLLELMAQIGALLGRVIEREQARDELAGANARLTHALAELKTAQDRVVQQERLRALGQMASGIAHDFNNALLPIRGYAELMADIPGVRADDRALRYLQTILTASGDAAAIVSRLREFFRPASELDAQSPVDLSRIARQIVELTRPRWLNESLLRGVTITVETELVPVPPVMGHEPQLREAITNLVFNAVDAMPDGGRIVISTFSAGPDVSIAVSDDGIGMSEDVQRHCLEPFFTTKGAGGSGLGLGMVYGIAKRHQGDLTIDSTIGKGTTFTLTFPAGDAAPVAAVETPARVAASGLRVLVVDDIPVARDLVEQLLASDGHTVVPCGGAADALQLLTDRQFDIVVTDRSMPMMTGVQLATAIKDSGKPVPVIMLTGVGQMLIDSSEWPPGVDLVLPKPVTRDALRSALAALCR